MLRPFAYRFLLCVMIAGCASGDGMVPIVDQVAIPQVTPLPPALPSRTFILDRIVMDIKRGTILGEVRRGTLCIFPEPHKWNSEPITYVDGRFHSEFDRVLSQHNFQVPAKPKSLFEAAKLTGNEFVVAARVVSIAENYCGAINVWAGNQQVVKGNTRLVVRWEVYSMVDDKVVLTYENSGSASQPNFLPRNETNYPVEAFGNALRGLLSNPEFRKLAIALPKTKGEL